MSNILIIGFGFVGKATKLFLTKNGVDPNDIQIYDPALGYEEIIHPIDFSFVCVPSPQGPNGRFDLSYIAKAVNMAPGKVIIRSTIGPDQIAYYPDCDYLPEFLREKHWREDAVSYDLPLVWGSDDHDGKLRKILTGTKRVITTDKKTAMMFKLARNSLLAARVALANELYDICELHDINYDNVKRLLKTDKDIGGSHYDVPGHDGERGFGGKCLPKDIAHMSSMSEVAFLFKSIYINNRSRRK